ncbi:hypothetical protein C8Q75DRAFT_809282 [Abortiporus biennis]|nr:hypothetical protein C8Q75DRAFT_809282 [Abortiporus biennis]
MVAASNLPSFHPSSCVGEAIPFTQLVKVSEHIVNITVDACPGAPVTSTPIELKDSLLAAFSPHQKRDVLDARASPSECSNPSICHCGEGCTLQCETFSSVGGDPPPQTGDCLTLGATFVNAATPARALSVSFQSCTVNFGVFPNEPNVEYCWDGLADNVVNVNNACIAPHVTLDGSCTAVSNIWEMSVTGHAPL